MSEDWREWPREMRSLPQDQLAMAAAHAGGGVMQIDRSMLPDPNGYAPEESVVGLFEVDAEGNPTGAFFRNPRYGPIQDDLTMLQLDPKTHPGLPNDPALSVKNSLFDMFGQQISGASLEWVKYLGEPIYVAGGPTQKDNPNLMTLRRVGLAVEFACSVSSPTTDREFLVGAFTLVVVDLDKPDHARSRVWMDIGMRIARADELLQERMFELDADRARS